MSGPRHFGEYAPPGDEALRPQVLIDAPMIGFDASLGKNAKVTLGGDRTLAFPTNAQAGQSGVVTVTQDGTGGRALSLAAGWGMVDDVSKIASGGAGNAYQITWYARTDSELTSTLLPLQ